MLRSKTVVVIAALALAVGILSVVSRRRGEAQSGSAPVRVVNTPLPVSGNVTADNVQPSSRSLATGSTTSISTSRSSLVPI